MEETTAETPPGSGPRQLGPYRILSQLGEGGMGIVYLADQQEPVQRRVAVKLMRDDRQGKEFVARFEMERRALERMEHPNIARVLGTGVTETGRPYFAMEYVQGLPLDRYCEKKRLSIEQRLRLFAAICAGVQHAHTNGIMHRDLKPGNILVTEVDDVPVPKIIDFGLARAIGVHSQRATLFEDLQRIIGTLAYMSPEQAGLEPDGLDARTDIYSLGVLLYELLTGRLPFDPAELERVGVLGGQQIIREREPVRPSTHFTTTSDIAVAKAAERRADPRTLWRTVVGELDWIVLKAMHKDRTGRYVTARDLARDVDNFLCHRPVEAGPPSAAYRLRKWARRHRFGVVTGLLASVAVLSSLTVGLVITAELAATRARLLSTTTEALLAGDPQVRRSLENEVDGLWPAMPVMAPAMRQWLDQADALWQRRDAHRELLAQLRTAARDPGLQARLEDHLRLLEEFGKPGGRNDLMKARHQDSVTIEERTITGTAMLEAWRAAGTRVRDNPRYAGMAELVPQIGLVPIGADPASTLEEFAVLQSGAVPRRSEKGVLSLELEGAIVLVLVPGGLATIGCGRGNGPQQHPEAQAREGPVQRVRLDPFFLSKYEMTQGQWHRTSGMSAARFRPDPFYDEEVRLGRLPAAPTMLHPVETVTWHECEKILRRLDLVLPTEAQWEFAARAGATASWYFAQGSEPLASFGKHANVADEFAAKWLEKNDGHWKETAAAVELHIDDGFLMTAPVGSLAANATGLHDVHGNVWEWCRDPHDDNNYAKGLRDGDGECLEGETWDAVVRGGGYVSDYRYTRVSFRESLPRDSRWPAHGVRPSRAYHISRRGAH